MAQNITLLGASYSAVPGVQLPKTGGGTALFTDVTPTTAAASDVAQGKIFFTSAGVQTTGTASGGGGGDSKNAQTVTQGDTRVANTAYTKACGDITVAKTGTYDVYWACYRSSTSGTWGTQLYKNGVAVGSVQSTFSSYYQTVHLTNVSLAKDDVISVYARSRGTSYYAYVGQLTIIEA